MKNNYSIFINTSDGYEDCWPPFFDLLKKYWPNITSPIFLNTGSKKFESPDIKIICTNLDKTYGNDLTWSEYLHAGLNCINDPIVLYFQEDYFIDSNVRVDLIDKAAALMMRHPDIKCISLTNHGSPGPYEDFHEDWLKVVSNNARYRISTQASLWRVDSLKSYLNPKENGWMFEIFGTWRSRNRNECFLTVNISDMPIKYLHTGIVKGKWLNGIQDVFLKNDISIDFSIRGFYLPKPKLLHKIEVIEKLLQKPVHFLSQFLLLFIKRFK